MRDHLLDLMWEHDKENLYISKAVYVKNFDGWEIAPHEVDGVMAAITVQKGPEFHFATLGVKWKLTRADLHRYFDPLLAQYGCVKTKTAKEDYRQQRFNRLIGFVYTGEDEFYIHFTLTRPLFSRKTSCH